MRSLNVLLALLVSAIIGLLVLEGGLRLLGLGPPHNLLTFDPHIGWVKKPDAIQHKKTSEYEVTLRTNALGLRDEPMSDPAKPANTFRVLALGDSFTQGWSVSRDDLFVDVLERWWQAENRRVDVINGGTEGWSTDQEVAWFLHRGVDFEPDLVLLLAYENDLFWCAETQYPPDLDKPRFTPDGRLEERELVDHSSRTWKDDFALTRLLSPNRPEPGRFDFVPEGGSKPILKEFGALLIEPPEFMLEAEARAAGALRALKSRCDELGARVVLVPIPSHSAVDEDHAVRFGQDRRGLAGLPRDRWSPDVPVDTFLRLAGEVGMEALDPRATLQEAARHESIYFDQDWHFNPAGNAVFARFIKGELDHRGIFPEGHRALTEQAEPVPAGPASAGVPFALKLYLTLWAVLSLLYLGHYRDEPKWQPPLKVAALLAAVFGVFLGARWLIGQVPPQASKAVFAGMIGAVLLFVAWKLGRRMGTIAELLKSFTLRGHWYLMPLIVVLLTVGSLLVVAASSPLVAPFIYTLF